MDRKCAIYNRISVENKTQLEKIRNILIEYCQKALGIKDYILFEEIGSVDGKRKEFEDMIDRIHKGEFTDLLVYHPNRIYRAEYNKEKFDNIINDIDKYAVLHSVVFEYESSPVIDKYLAVLKKENEYFEKFNYFSQDMISKDIEINRLDNQVLVRYFDEEWGKL